MMSLAADTTRVPTMKLCSAATLDELNRWFDGAAPGHRAEYASGHVFPREAASVKRARELEEAGLATLVTRRDEHTPGRTIYLIVKLEKAAVVCIGDVEGGAAKEQKRRLMQRLRQLAGSGEPCPKYADLAEIVGLDRSKPSGRRVRHLLEQLEKDGQITIHPGDAKRGPAITIRAPGRARGKSTARRGEAGGLNDGE